MTSGAWALREGSTLWKILNFTLMQAAWFACVLGSRDDAVWIGWAVTLAFFVFHFALAATRRADALLSLFAVAMGFVYETFNRWSGVVTVTSDFLPHPWAASWLLLLWVAFALAIRHSMAWMSGRYVVGAVLGAVAGPVSWRGGAALGGVTLSSAPAVAGVSVPWWVVLGVEWGAAMPLLLLVASRAAAATPPPEARSPAPRPS